VFFEGGEFYSNVLGDKKNKIESLMSNTIDVYGVKKSDIKKFEKSDNWILFDDYYKDNIIKKYNELKPEQLVAEYNSFNVTNGGYVKICKKLIEHLTEKGDLLDFCNDIVRLNNKFNNIYKYEKVLSLYRINIGQTKKNAPIPKKDFNVDAILKKYPMFKTLKKDLLYGDCRYFKFINEYVNGVNNV
jgi:hypothetical protein